MIPRPTARGWGLLVLAVSSFIFALFSLSLIPSLFAAALSAILLVSAVASWFSLWGVELVREPGENGIVDRRISLPVTVRNRFQRQRQAMVVHEKCSFVDGGHLLHTVPPLPAGESVYLPRPIAPTARGEYQLDRITLRGGDPAGFFRREKHFSFPQAILIQPKFIPLSHLPLRLRNRVHAAANGRPIGVSGSGQEFFGIREYRPSDSIRLIHWKASARQDRLMVMEFEENSTQQVTIVLDSSSRYVSRYGEPSNFEFQIQIAASLIEFLSGTHNNLLVAAGDDARQAWIRGAAQTIREEAMYTLATIQPGTASLRDRLNSILDVILPNSILYCLSLEKEPKIDDLLDLLLAMGVEIRHIHAPAELFKPLPPSIMPKLPEFAEQGVWGRPVIINPRVNIAKVLSYG